MRLQVRSAVAVLLLTLAGGCATPSGPDRTTVASGIAERTGLSTIALPTGVSDWSSPPGTNLDDGVSVEEAVAIALWNNAAFQASLASLGLARADLLEAGLLKNPVFSLLFPWGPKQLEFTATFAVDQIWQRPKRIADARLNAEAVAAQQMAAGLRLVGDVRSAFYDVLVADRRLSLAVEQADIAGQAARLAEGQLRAGDISDLETRLARADALRLETVRLSRHTSRDLAVVHLRTLLGLPPLSPPVRLSAPAEQVADSCGASDSLFTAALAARPEVRAAELLVEAAGVRAGLERGRIMSFTASLDANAKGSQGFEMGPGVAIEIPVLSQNQGRRARATAELEQASRRYLATRASVSAEVATAVAGLADARATAALLNDETGASVATARQQAERLRAAGEISLLTLLQTRQRLIELDTARVDAAFGVQRALVRLEQAVGTTCRTR